MILVIAVVIGLVFVVKDTNNHAAADSSKITSGVKGYCLDDYKDVVAQNNPVDNYQCNDTSAQVWNYSNANITFRDNYCLSVIGNQQAVNSQVVLAKCDNSSGQIWLKDGPGFYNPNSQSCLISDPSDNNNDVKVGSCDNLANSKGAWTAISENGKQDSITQSCEGSEGQQVACEAENEWTLWQSGTISHQDLLNKYTGGAAYEEWCADFVSYVYKEAGYPFTNGEYSGWDENNANNIQYMGFTYHDANSGYIPKTGDVAYFNYNDGHVEIVVSGGKNPTFIYGDSATIDPTTGNGQMKANTIVKDGEEGQLVYYLSPN